MEPPPTLHGDMQQLSLGGDDETEQATLRTALNAVNSSTRNLPSEILSTIFQFTYPSPSFSESFRSHKLGGTGGLKMSRKHFSLAAVSSLWRQVVYSTPQLWTSVVLHRDSPQLLELHIAQSQSLHLSLEFLNSHSWLDLKPLAANSVLSKIAYKLKALILVDLKDKALDCLSTVRFPFLEKLGVISTSDAHKISKLELTTTAPLLQHVYFYARPNFINFVHFELPWSHITSFHFAEIPTHISIQALHHCRQSLVHFHGQADFTPWSAPNTSTIQAPLTLPYLESFCWSYIDEPETRSLFHQLRMPILQSLDLSYQYPVDESWSILFQNLPPTLRKLKLRGFHVRDTARDFTCIPYPAYFFECTPYLQEMALYCCTIKFVNEVLAILGLVRDAEDEPINEGEEGKGGPIHLPHLRKLVISDYFPLNVDMSGMVKKRFAGRSAGLPTYSISRANLATAGEGVFLEQAGVPGVVLVVED